MRPILTTLLAALGLACFTPVHAATPILAAGNSHAIAVNENGVGVAWGSDQYGQLGQGRNVAYATQRVISPGVQFRAVAAGFSHALAVDLAGNVWAWGSNNSAQLGIRTSGGQTVLSQTTPAVVSGVAGAREVAAGSGYSAALLADRTVWMWGAVLGGTGADFVPRRIVELDGTVTLSGGQGHLLALKADGSVWAMGSNSVRQLGDGTTTSRAVPVQVIAGGVRQIAAGPCQSLAVRNDGTLLSWGSTGCSSSQGSGVPTVVAGAANIISIAPTQGNNYAGTMAGLVHEFGDAQAFGTPVSDSLFTGVVGMAGYNTLYMLKGNGTLAAYAIRSGAASNPVFNELGELCNGAFDSTSLSNTLQAAGGIARFAALGNGLLTLASDGTLRGCGDNTLGAMGDGSTLLSLAPRAIPGLPANVTAIANGQNFSLARTADGRVYAWGNNQNGQLGFGDRVPRSVPTLVPGLSNVTSIAAGSTFSLFGFGTGTVSYSGALSQFTTVSVPTGIAGISGAANPGAVAATSNSGHVLRDDGLVLSFGSGAQGQLGNGSTANSATPVQAVGIAQIVELKAGGTSIVARDSAGNVYGWGSNGSGALCIAGATFISSPTRIMALGSSVSRMAVGVLFSLYIEAGLVKVCGTNAVGQLGINDTATASSTTPVQALSIVNGEAIAAGGSTVFASRTDGLVFGWAGNYASINGGAVGDGASATRYRPVSVLAAGDGGTLESNNWFLDLKPSVATSVPAAIAPKVLVSATTSGSSNDLSLVAKTSYKQADLNKTVSNFAIGLVPRRFVNIIVNTLTSRRLPVAKADSDLVLVQLTPTGWQVVTGQLTAVTTNVATASGSSNTILRNLNTSLITGGGAFCVGYGTDANDMLNSGNLAEVLTLPGAATTSGGLPCLKSGAYLTGPDTSIVGQSTTFNATVIGAEPTNGSLTLRNGTTQIGAPLALTPQNAAVAVASFTQALAGPAVYALTASYSGDGGNNPAATSQAHAHSVLNDIAVTLSGPTSAAEGVTVTFTATVSAGATGTIQFKDAGSNLGSPVTIVGNQASISTNQLIIGTHSITAAYSGDASNAARTSIALSFNVTGTPPGVPTIEVSAGNNQSATVNGTFGTPIKVLVKDPAMQPAANVLVAFAAPTSGASATLSAVNVLTAADGTAQVNATANTSDGTYMITATIPSGASTSFMLTNVPAPDTTPDAFSFSAQSGVPLNTPITSSSITVAGINTASPISVTGGEYSIGCTSSFTSAPGTVRNGETVCVRHTSSSSPGGSVSTTLTIGGVSSTFSSTASAVDPNADGDGDGVPNGVEATLGLNASVKDNDIFATTSLGARLFAMQQYRDFLAREGDQGGIDFWTNAIVTGAQTRAAMIENYFNSAEFQAAVAPATRLYFAAFLRVPDYGGLTFWTAQFKAGVPLASIGNSFATSPEFVQRYGNLDNTGFVNQVYMNVLQRPGDAAGVAFWVGQLNAGVSRGTVLTSFSESPEYQARIYNSVYVCMMYVGMLRRAPDQGGFEFWKGFMDGGQSGQALINSFLPAQEYRARFLP
jgi:alpha-tubulin suppressor-like RCC1 family protein